MTLNVVVADFSPLSEIELFATAPSALGFRLSGRRTIWIAADGSGPVAAPDAPTKVSTAWTRGLADRDPPVSVSIERWRSQLAGSLARAQACGDAVLVDLVNPRNDSRSLWWCRGDQATRLRARVSDTIRVEVIGDGLALLVDPDAKRFELLTPDREPTLIMLPPVIAAELEISRVAYRVLTALSDGRVVLATGGRAYWFMADELVAAASGDTIEWRYHHVFPAFDLDARLDGTVTVSASYGTHIKTDDGLTWRFAKLLVEKGERVTFVGRWTFAENVAYRELIRADGTRLPLREEVAIEREVTPVRRAAVASPALVIPAPIRTGVAAMRAEGLLGALDDALLVELADGLVHLRDLLLRYYEDDTRARTDRFLTHDWRFGQETDDVILELSALLDGPPLFRQLEVREDTIVVEGPSGQEEIEVESLGDVVAHFNGALSQLGRPTRIFQLDPVDDQLVYFAMPLDVARRLIGAGVPLLLF